MAEIVPFVTKKGARIPKALTKERMLKIAGLMLALQAELNEAHMDLEYGMPYLGTSLRLQERVELPPLVIDQSETILRNANGLH